MKSVFFIPGPIPGMNEILDAANSYYWINAKNGRGRVKLSKYTEFKKKWNNRIASIIGNQKLISRVWINFVWIERDRKRDPDNIAAAKKIIIDGMVEANLIKNDGWNQIAGWIDRFYVSKKYPAGCLVIVREAHERNGRDETKFLIKKYISENNGIFQKANPIRRGNIKKFNPGPMR